MIGELAAAVRKGLISAGTFALYRAYMTVKATYDQESDIPERGDGVSGRPERARPRMGVMGRNRFLTGGSMPPKSLRRPRSDFGPPVPAV